MCQYISKNPDGTESCLIAFELSGVDCQTSEGACTKCKSLHDAMCPNSVTASLAISGIRKHKPDDLRKMMKHLDPLFATHRTNHENIGDGPGTELKRILSWFATDTPSCECLNHAITMNTWGPDGCRINMEIILEWLKIESEAREIPYSKGIAKALVNLAIRRAEKKCLLKKPS